MNQSIDRSSRSIFIPGAVMYHKGWKRWVKKSVPSQKNGMANGMYMHKGCVNFIKQASVHFHRNYEKWLELTDGKDFPLKVQLTFARVDNKRFDYINAAQIIMDCMSGHHYKKTTNKKNGDLDYTYVYSGIKNPNFSPKRVKWVPSEGYTGEEIPFDLERLCWIPDDDHMHVKPFFSDPFIDAENPGVYISVLR